MPEQGSELRSLLIPIHGDTLILPSAVVAEVISYTEPVAATGGPAWLLGEVPWRRQQLPVIALETALGTELPAKRAQRARIIVMYGLGNTERLPFFGLLSRGIPRAYLASAGNVSQLATTGDDGQRFVLAKVGLQPEGTAIIPDLDGLQNALLEQPSA